MSEWKTISLGELGKFTNGINKSAEDFGHGVPFVNLLDVFGVSTLSHVPAGLVNAREVEVLRYCLQVGDVLFVRSSVKPSGVGLTAVVLRDLPRTVFSGFLIRFRPDYSHCVPGFLGHCFHGGEFRASLLSQCTVSANTNINQERLKALSITLPPILEQTKIAEILSTVDRAIEQTEALIAKQQRLKTGLMQDLLTRGIDHHGNLRSEHTHEFKDSPLGRIPVEWEVTPLSSVVDLQVGYAFKSSWFVEEGVKLLRGENVGTGKADWKDTRCLSLEASESHKDYALAAGDMIIGMDRTFTKQGFKVTLLTDDDVPCLLVQRVGRFVPMTVPKEFMQLLIQSPAYQRELLLQQKGMDIPHLSKSEILTPSVPVPREQTEMDAIASEIAKMNATLSSTGRSLPKLRALKTALMQDLLTGRRRITALLEVDQPLKNSLP
ncbi:MAG: restriction endonuclease subunit S [Verrucomicrobia bacterium]|nr:restriction endonuclease subunit S [Verrucomicrobiota bacterium]